MDVIINGVSLCPCHASIFSLLQNVFLQSEEGLISMARFLYRLSSFTLRKVPILLLALSWLFGLGIGGVIFRYAGRDIVPWMPVAASCHLSIHSLLGSLLLPFLFAVFAVYVSLPSLLYPICFGKAVSFSCIVCAVTQSFPQGAWLVRLLLLFSDQIAVVLLLVFCLTHISGERRFSAVNAGGYFAAVAVCAAVDVGYVAPFLQGLLIK